MTLAPLLCWGGVIVMAAADKGHFDEDLLLRPLPSGHTVAHFSFLNSNSWQKNHHHSANEPVLSRYDIFPKTLGQLMDFYGVEELRLSSTSAKAGWLATFAHCGLIHCVC